MNEKIPKRELVTDRNLALDLVRVTEAAALAASRWMAWAARTRPMAPPCRRCAAPSTRWRFPAPW